MLKKYEKSLEYKENYSTNIGKGFEYIRLLVQKLLPKKFCKKLQKCGVYLHLLLNQWSN